MPPAPRPRAHYGPTLSAPTGRARRCRSSRHSSPTRASRLGLETIYEGYLLHYGRSRLFDPPDEDVALLLGDALLAQGLVLVAATGSVAAVADLAELLALCTQARADDADGDGAAWAATAALLGRGGLDEARAALRDARDPAPLERLARARRRTTPRWTPRSLRTQRGSYSIAAR